MPDTTLATVRSLEGAAVSAARTAASITRVNDAAALVGTAWARFWSMREQRYALAPRQARHCAKLCRDLADALEAEARRLGGTG